MVLSCSYYQPVYMFLFSQAAGEKKKNVPLMAKIISRSNWEAGGRTETSESVLII